MTVNEYAEQVVQGFITDITDNLFLSIERNEAKMRDYMTNVNRFGKQELNMAIGKKLKVTLELKDAEDKSPPPQSQLITAYTRLKKD